MKKGMKYLQTDGIHPDYLNQQQVIMDVCKELGLVAFYPDYHGQERDKNTVLVYLPEDDEFNRKLEKQGCWDTNLYEKPIFTFENSDVNGFGDYGFANFGRLDLRGSRYKRVIRGAISLAYFRRMQNDYINACGGILGIREGDDTYNGFNRSIIRAFSDMTCGSAVIGKVNERFDSGEIMETPKEPLYNFCCDFIVPKKDETLEELIEGFAGNAVSASKVMNHIERLHGLNIVWF